MDSTPVVKEWHMIIVCTQLALWHELHAMYVWVQPIEWSKHVIVCVNYWLNPGLWNFRVIILGVLILTRTAFTISGTREHYVPQPRIVMSQILWGRHPIFLWVGHPTRARASSFVPSADSPSSADFLHVTFDLAKNIFSHAPLKVDATTVIGTDRSTSHLSVM